MRLELLYFLEEYMLQAVHECRAQQMISPVILKVRVELYDHMGGGGTCGKHPRLMTLLCRMPWLRIILLVMAVMTTEALQHMQNMIFKKTNKVTITGLKLMITFMIDLK